MPTPRNRLFPSARDFKPQLFVRLAAAAVFALGVSVGESKDVSVATFGLTHTGTTNATPYVRAALAALRQQGGGTLVFPKGVYHFDVDGTEAAEPYVSNNEDDFPKLIAIPLKGAKNLTIDGGGSLFLFHHRMMAFSISNSERVTLKNLAIDFTRPIHSDSTLLEIADDSFVLQFSPEITWQIDDAGAFRFVVDGKKVDDWSGYAFDGKSGETKYRAAESFGTPLAKRKATDLGGGRVRFAGKPNPRYEVGDRITFRHNNRNDVAIFINQSKDTALTNLIIHHACAMGVVGQRSENIKIDRLRVAPRAGTGRISTTVADATHFSGCKGRIEVTNSHFEGMMDDAINVHGTSLKITEIVSPRTLIARFMHGQSKGFEIASPGDEIRVINNETLLPLVPQFVTVASAEALDVNRVKLVFTEDLPSSLQPGHAIENITWTPEVRFAHNKVIKNRARGMLFNTPRTCVVEKNFVRTSGSAVLVAGDANGWYESGAVGEFGPTLIRDNVFEDCLTNMFQFCRAVVSIDPEIRRLDRNQCYHRDIRITGNTFRVFDAPLVYAKSVAGLEISGNTIERTQSFEPWHPNRDAFVFEGCREVRLDKNAVKGTLLSRKIVLREMDSVELKTAPSEPFQP
jgi:hypothetical protein